MKIIRPILVVAVAAAVTSCGTRAVAYDPHAVEAAFQRSGFLLADLGFTRPEHVKAEYFVLEAVAHKGFAGRLYIFDTAAAATKADGTVYHAFVYRRFIRERNVVVDFDLSATTKIRQRVSHALASLRDSR